jgi:hypothetical protein
MKASKNIKWFFLIGLLIYSLSFIATRKNDPCRLSINAYLEKDTTLGNYVYLSTSVNDTLKIDADTLNPNIINWNRVTDSVCNILNNSCGNSNQVILVINSRDTTRSNWDTRLGKKIFSKQCP